MKKLIIFVLLINSLIIANGQNADKKWALGLLIGKTDYNGDLRPSALDLIKDMQIFDDAKIFGGLSINRYLNKSFDLGFQATFGKIGYTRDAVKSFDGTKIDGNLLLSYKLNNGYIFKTDAFIAPYIAGGIGFANFDNESGILAYNPITKDFTIPGPIAYSTTEFTYSFGGGLKFNFTPSIALQLQELYTFTSDKIDVYESNVADGYFSSSVGLIFSFGKPKDTDKDGVPDKTDKCSNTPEGVSVDAYGCPLDSDKDGVADYIDKCPNTPSGIKVDADGCTLDSDKDGIADNLDKCPNTPSAAKVDASGCPVDSDKDGVADYLDKCPNTTANIKVDANGCPLDSDGDGVAENLDKCPNTPANVTVDANGCPLDKDADGVADYLDKCPDVAGTKENNGCPDTKTPVKVTPAPVPAPAPVKVPVKKDVSSEKKFQSIYFDYGIGVIFVGSHKDLNKVAKAMKANPNSKLQINGHADSEGSAKKNQDLSEKRAANAKAYLINKGIEESRMKTTGYGDTMPAGDNKTEEGKQQNRRVDFILE